MLLGLELRAGDPPRKHEGGPARPNRLGETLR
jgi:hypothetical protein